ncbi:MAG TPA: GIY-YIG nuclease family protein [Bryobacteraceae bacterium]|nr:GIY-YIG nuclease family protein [Bryobacteraceae bacterium]
MSTASRREAIRAYKERKPQRGVYALRCTAAGRVWVGAKPNLDAARNLLWFALGNGLHGDLVLQNDWNTHGEAAFCFEVLEKLKDDVSPLAIHDLLKEKKLEWLARLSASPL